MIYIERFRQPLIMSPSPKPSYRLDVDLDVVTWVLIGIQWNVGTHSGVKDLLSCLLPFCQC